MHMTMQAHRIFKQELATRAELHAANGQVAPTAGRTVQRIASSTAQRGPTHASVQRRSTRW